MIEYSRGRSGGQLKLDDHVCFVYDTPEEHAQVLTPYLKAGLDRGEKVVYLADYSSGATIHGYLEKVGVDLDLCLRSGQFSVNSAADVYLPNGAFDPGAMIEFLGKATKQALDEGFSGLRATGEMTWVLEGRPGSEKILEYESRTNKFFKAGCRAVGLCQYRRSRFPAKTLLEILKTHPTAAVSGDFYKNCYYIPPDVYLSPREPEAMLDRCLTTLRQVHSVPEPRKPLAVPGR